ncbi:MAG TPA: relaxase [Pilimelia sp.]|nr:relaxase [Pilimelia sp.]
MIPKVAPRGTRVGGLLRYLYGPGKREEHADPHLVAAWAGAGPMHTLEPAVGVDGKRDFRPLVDLLEQPVRAGRNPPAKTVWHCSVRNHAADRILTDQQWAHIAGEVMAQAGLAPHGDDRAVRWVAVRHAADHIHIVATLVRQDRRTEWARNDRWRAQAACRNLEERYGLYRVGPADPTAHTRPHSVEVNKARRTGRHEAGRDQLRREVRFAAAAAGTVGEFVDLLRAAGVLVELRPSSIHPGEFTGYKVALADHATAAGDPVWYSGGRLAPDLTLPKLRRRWATSTPDGPPRTAGRPRSPAGAYDGAAEQVRAATAEARRLAGDDPQTAAAAGYAAADTLAVAAQHAEGTRRGPLHRAVEAFDRAAREPYGRIPPRTSRAEALRAMARLLRVAGHLSDDKTLFAMLRLIISLSLFADALAEIRDSQRRLHQARAARTPARLLRAAAGAGAPPASATPGAGVTPPMTPPATPPLTPHRDPRRHSSTAAAGRGR